MIFNSHFYTFLIVVVFIKQNFACTYEKRYDEIEQKEQKNVTKTRTVCCNGYIRNKEEHNKVICYPECKNCLQGYCFEPSKCICNDGYTGDNCTERCADGKWGKNCLGTCNCLNGAQCDHKNGYCICVTGWTGKNCEKSSMKERINAANWVRVDDTPEHDKILKNISTVLNKFTESVEHLHETVASVKTSKQVEGTEAAEKNQNIRDTDVTNPEAGIVPEKLEEKKDKENLMFNTIYPPLLIGLSMLIIILTVFLTIKIRSTITNIRKIQKNPTEVFRNHLKNHPDQTDVSQHPSIHPTQTAVVTTIPSSIPAQKPLVAHKLRRLPEIPPETIYDSPTLARESNSYVPMVFQKPLISPINDKSVQSFIHSKQPGSSLNFGIKLPGFHDEKATTPPQEVEEIYEDLKQIETQYEELGHYSKSK